MFQVGEPGLETEAVAKSWSHRPLLSMTSRVSSTCRSDGSHALAWLPRAQLAAAQVLAWIDEGWDGSARRKALLSLLYGPFDWTTGAAIRVLARIAIEEKDYALQIHQCFEVLERHLPTQGHWDWVQILYQEWRTIPFLFDQERDEMKRKELAVSGQS